MRGPGSRWKCVPGQCLNFHFENPTSMRHERSRENVVCLLNRLARTHQQHGIRDQSNNVKSDISSSPRGNGMAPRSCINKLTYRYENKATIVTKVKQQYKNVTSCVAFFFSLDLQLPFRGFPVVFFCMLKKLESHCGT